MDNEFYKKHDMTDKIGMAASLFWPEIKPRIPLEPQMKPDMELVRAMKEYGLKVHDLLEYLVSGSPWEGKPFQHSKIEAMNGFLTWYNGRA